MELGLKSSLRTMVMGAGTMGQGLALLAAKSGHTVTLVDIDAKALKQAVRLIGSQLEWLHKEGELGTRSVREVARRIEPLQDFDGILPSCDLILEAISEDKDLKAALFQKISPTLSRKCVVASNTSYLDVFALAPEELLPRLAIAHFYAPPYLIPLVEVVGGEKTDPAILPWLKEVLLRMGQQPVVMRRFIPGYIANRLQRAMAREIFHLLEGGFASPEDIDTAIQASLGVRIPVLGVVRRYDFTGLDISLKFLENPSIELVSEDKIPQRLKTLVGSGALGVKSGRGFYDYGKRSFDEILRDRDQRILALRRFLAKERIAMKT